MGGHNALSLSLDRLGDTAIMAGFERYEVTAT